MKITTGLKTLAVIFFIPKRNFKFIAVHNAYRWEWGEGFVTVGVEEGEFLPEVHAALPDKVPACSRLGGGDSGEELLHVVPLPFHEQVHELHVVFLPSELGEIGQSLKRLRDQSQVSTGDVVAII